LRAKASQHRVPIRAPCRKSVAPRLRTRICSPKDRAKEEMRAPPISMGIFFFCASVMGASMFMPTALAQTFPKPALEYQSQLRKKLAKVTAKNWPILRSNLSMVTPLRIGGDNDKLGASIS